MKKPEEIELDTKTLRFIVAIVDEGGLSRAAEALYLSQPALSRYLKRAEETLGTPVFYREHSGLTLTAAGKVFINGARSMLWNRKRCSRSRHPDRTALHLSP